MANRIKDPQAYISVDCDKVLTNVKNCSEFKKITMANKDLFMLAVLFGCLKGKMGKEPLRQQDKTKSGYFREKYLKDKDHAILKAIALFENNNIETATRDKIPEVYALAEQYANGGYGDLKRFVFEQPGSFTKKFAALLSEKKNEQLR